MELFVFAQAEASDYIGLIVSLVLIFGTTMLFIFSRVKKCPPDKLMVVYGKVGLNPDGTSRTFWVQHAGVKFITPFIQKYGFIDLHPFNVDMNFTFRSKDKELMSVESKFAFGVSTMVGVKENAASFLFNQPKEKVEEIGKDIILGQFRHLISQTESEKIDRVIPQDFVDELVKTINEELGKVGLRLINFNIKDIIKK